MADENLPKSADGADTATSPLDYGRFEIDKPVSIDGFVFLRARSVVPTLIGDIMVVDPNSDDSDDELGIIGIVAGWVTTEREARLWLGAMQSGFMRGEEHGKKAVQAQLG